MASAKPEEERESMEEKKKISLKPNHCATVYTLLTTRKIILGHFQHCLERQLFTIV
jgi:hypothetical protein